MNIELIRNITIAGARLHYIIGFSLHQKFNAHHEFEVRFNHDLLGTPGLINLDGRRELLGKTLVASFRRGSGQEQKFIGIVTHVSIEQSHGFHGVVVAKGYSPTILLERGEDMASFYNKSLLEVARIASRDIAGNDLNMVCKPVFMKPVKQLIQYEESDFAFLNRLSAAYREWFYFDGERLLFGRPDKQKEIKLVYGRDLQSLDYGIHVEPLQSKQFAYDVQNDTVLQGNTTGIGTGAPDLQYAASVANTVFSKRFNQNSIAAVADNGDITTLVENFDKARVSDLLKVVGHSDQPSVGIGKIVDLSMSLKQQGGFITTSIGKFLITTITHEMDIDGKYKNRFEAIPADTEQLPPHAYHQPRPNATLAEVFDHADPLGIGRVRVKFKWQTQQNDPTDWIRVMSPDAGNSEKMPKNRGFVFVPEKGDQVLIGFEDANPNKPFVMGSLFHGKNAAGGMAENNHKSISSKSGHAIHLDDAAGITIADKTDLNYITIDGKDSILIRADQYITLQAGNVLLTLDGAQDKIILQAKSIAIKADERFTVAGDGRPTQQGDMAFAKDFKLVSKQSILVAGEQKMALNAGKLEIKGDKTSVYGNPVHINS